MRTVSAACVFSLPGRPRLVSVRVAIGLVITEKSFR